MGRGKRKQRESGGAPVAMGTAPLVAAMHGGEGFSDGPEPAVGTPQATRGAEPPAATGLAPVSTWVEELRSNIKGTHPEGWKLALAPKTLIVGPNASGKTSLISALELALTGRVSRIDKREAALMALAPGKKGKLFSSVTLSDGSIAAYETGGDTARAKKAKHDLPQGLDSEAVLPLRPIQAALAGSIDTARKYFLKLTCGDVKHSDIEGRLPPQLVHRYREVQGVPHDALGDLLKAQEKARQLALDASTRVKVSSGDAERNAAGLAPEPTETEVSESKRLLDQGNQAVEAAVAAGAAAYAREPLDRQLTESNTRLQALEAERVSLVAQIDQVPLVVMPEHVSHVLGALDWVARGGTQGTCPVCGTNHAPEELTRATGTFAAQLRQALSAQSAQLLQRESLIKRLAQVEGEMQTRVASVTGATAALRQLDSVGPAPEGVETLRAQRDTALGVYAALQRTQAAWKQVRTARALAVDAERQLNELKQLEEEISRVIGELLDTVVGEFESKVQGFLPGQDAFRLKLRDGHKETLEFGFERPGPDGVVVHTELSGAESVRALVALVGALRRDSFQLVLIDSEFAAFDSETLSIAMEAFGRVPLQVVIASPVAPTEPVAGWYVVELE